MALMRIERAWDSQPSHNVDTERTRFITPKTQVVTYSNGSLAQVTSKGIAFAGFDGTTKFAEILAAGKIAPPFTIYFKLRVASYNLSQPFVSCGGAGAGKGWAISNRYTGGVTHSVRFTFGGVADYDIGPNSLNGTEWNDVCLTVRNSSTAYLKTNRGEYSMAVGVMSTPPAKPLTIGASYSTSYAYALSGTEITDILIIPGEYGQQLMRKVFSDPYAFINPDTFYIPTAAGGTVYTVDATDGIYFFDGEDNRDTSKTILDSMFVNSLQSRAQDMQFSDQLLTSDGLTKQLEKIVLDSLFVGDSSTVEALGTALSITVIDYLFLNDTVVKDIQKVVQESLLMSSSIVKLLELINREDILLSSQVFRGIDINRYDPLYINWVLFKTLDINTIDPLLMDDTDRLFLLRELLIRDNILINEFTLTQLYTLVTAVLVYAKISTVDFLGIGIAMNKNFLGITHSVYTGANQ